MPDSTPAPDKAKTKATRHRRLVVAIALLGVLLLLPLGLALVAVQTEWGARQLWQLATRALPGRLSGDLAGGTLVDGIRVHNLAYRDQERIVRIDRLEGAWRLSRSPLKLTIESLRFGNIDVTLLPSPQPPKPPALPADIMLPLAIELERATVERIVMHRDEDTTKVSDIRLNADSDRVHHRLNLQRAILPWGTVHASLQLDGKPPFAIAGTGGLVGSWRKERYRVDARISGTLEATDILVDASGDRLKGNARVEATPFAAVPFRRAQVDVRHLNPRMFQPGAPQADLRIQADVIPVNANAPADLSQLTVAGPVAVTNAQPGPVDKDLLPLASASATVRMDAQRQRLSQVAISLVGGATLKGSGELHANGEGRLALQANRLDLHALHTALQPTQLQGPLTLRLEQDAQLVEVDLADRMFSVQADARITPQQVRLQAAQLRSGPAQLNVSGTLERDTKSAYSVQGKLTDFNPAAFLASVQAAGPKRRKTAAPRIPDARINMEFDAHGMLKPELEAKLKFGVHDSMYDKLPLTGGGTLHLAGRQVLSSDAELVVAGNRVKANGGFGAPGQRLNFAIDAPALARLGFGLSGLLQAEGRLGGTLTRPVVDADLRAERLVFGQYRVARLSGRAHTAGVPGTTPDARIALDVDARDLQAEQIALRELHAAIEGTYAAHTIDLVAGGQLRGRPLAVSLAAQGRLEERPQGLAWNGTLRSLENRGFPRFLMQAPLAVSVAPGQVELGATRLIIEQAVLDLANLRYQEAGPISSQGAFRSLDVGHLLELRRQLTGEQSPVQTDLVLDGEWNLALADAAAGFFRIERRRGDIAVPTGYGYSALGLTEMGLRGDLDGRRVKLDTKVAATRIGTVNGQGEISLQPSSGRLMPDPTSAVTGRISASIPRLQSIASLAGPRVALDGSVDINLLVGGVLSSPVLSGEVNGNRLALTLFDQGVRLRDGVARIALDNNIVDLRQVEFRGGSGTLRATGRIPLDATGPDLRADIVADRLQLLAAPASNLTVSGRATVASVNQQLEVAGKFVVDRALFSLPEKSAPKLDDDVVIVRDGGPATTKEAGAREPAPNPFLPRINVEVDLGRNFRFEGSGADLRLAGTLAIQSAPGQPPQAFGTVRIAEGTFEAFGAELEIESGVLNFQGSFTNPNINIRAMRREEDVAAGVQITGTAQQPRVALISEPDLPEEEKLSWLVFGRGGGSAEAGQAQSAARSAAVGLLNKFGGARIAKGIGLDELSIGASEFGLGKEQVVSLGKEISDRLFVGYEQSLAGAASVFKLTYELSRHWSVMVRGGDIAGVELSYSNRFDRIFKR